MAGDRVRTSRVIAGVATVITLPLLILIDYLIASLRGWTLEIWVERVVVILAATTVVVVLLSCLSSKGRRFLATQLPKLVLLMTSIVIGLVVAELAVSLVLRPGESFRRFHRKPPHSHFVRRPSPEIMPGVDGDAHYTTNSWGVRGSEPPPRDSAYRILCVGGSTTISAYLNDDETWAHLLMERLNKEGPDKAYWVGNAGKAGYAGVHHARLLEEDNLLRQVDCIVCLLGINDLNLALRQKKPRLRTGLPPLWRRSALMELITGLVRQHQASVALEIEDDKGEAYVARRKRRADAPSSEELPDLREGLDDFASHIRSMHDRALAAGVRLVFLSQPVLWSSTPEDTWSLMWFGRLSDGSYLSIPSLRKGMDIYNKRLQAVCEEEGIEFVDLSSMNGRSEFFYDDCHFTEAGAVEVSRLVAQHFIDK